VGYRQPTRWSADQKMMSQTSVDAASGLVAVVAKAVVFVGSGAAALTAVHQELIQILCWYFSYFFVKKYEK
jgi:hypothetical protein